MGRYDDLNRKQLIELLEKRDRERKLGLVWERDEIEADQAIDQNFIVARIDEAASDRPAPWDNLIIEGDNYDALRWLRMTHRGQVKCIYIDPPYNTGKKDWVYNDRYMSADDRFRQSTWLEFMFRRLSLARDLLAEDGVLLISINDDQRALLELMAEQALHGMKGGSFVWRTRTGGNEGGPFNFSENHEHVLFFAKSGSRFRGEDKSFNHYSNPDNDPRGDWTKDNMTKAHSRFERPNTYYPIYDPVEDIWYPCNPDAVWRYSTKSRVSDSSRLRTKTIESFIEEKQIYFPKSQRVEIWQDQSELSKAVESGDVPRAGRAPLLREDTPDLEFWIGKRVGFGTPRFKRFKKDLKSLNSPLSSWVTPKSETHQNDEETMVSGTNDEGAKEIKSVFGSKAFNYAKPVSLIRELLRQSTGPGDLVLDFFAGSGTTAQAVMELNNENEGERRFVLVSSTEATNEDPDKNLCREVTAERVRRLNASEEKKYAELKAGFAYLKTHEIDFADFDYEAKSSDAWTALEAMHGLPLTKYDESQPWNIHDAEAQTLVLVDRFELPLLDWLQENSRRNLHVYAWAPGQITQRMEGFHVPVLPVRETLVRAFRA